MSEKDEIDDILRLIRERESVFDVKEKPLEPPKTRAELFNENKEDDEEEKEETKSEEEEEKEEEAPKEKKSKKRKKKNLKPLFALIIIAAIVFGGIKIYDYSKTAYIKPYEKKYGIEYPGGILEEYCDEYGKNQDVVGSLEISDTKTKAFVYTSSKAKSGFLQIGSDVYTPQKYRAVILDLTGADIKSVYGSADGFLNASQKVMFGTLFEKKSTYRVIAAYYVNTNPEDDDDYVFPYNLFGDMTEDSFPHYLDRIQTRRLYDTGYTLTYDDEVVTFSVKSDFMENSRFVITCVKDDSLNFKKSKVAKKNTKIRYPQKYYDDRGEENPYRFASKWYPVIYTDESHTETRQTTYKDF